MTALLYTETNFLMSYATGRSAATDSLISGRFPSIRIVVPSPCFMEAFSTLETERERHNRLMSALETEIQQAKRNVVSPNAQALVAHLQGAVVESRSVFNDFEDRLFRAIGLLSSSSERIDPTPEVYRDSLDNILIDDPTDNLILATIISHATLISSQAIEPKVFLTENRKCFYDNLEVRLTIQKAGLRYSADPTIFLEWYESLPDQ